MDVVIIRGEEFPYEGLVSFEIKEGSDWEEGQSRLQVMLMNDPTWGVWREDWISTRTVSRFDNEELVWYEQMNFYFKDRRKAVLFKLQMDIPG